MSKYQKVEYEFPVKAIHGKPCKHTKTYFAVNKFSGKPYMSRLCNPSTKPASAEQLEQRQLFANASAYAKTRMLDATKRAVDEPRFAQQTKYKTLRTFLICEFMRGDGLE